MIWLIVLAAGCGSDLACAAGTLEKDGTCVVDPKALQCGPGTQRVGSECVIQGSDASGGDVLSDSAAADAIAEVDGSVDSAADVSACVPFCVGKQCGSDGCGGTCGNCTSPAAPYCNASLGTCSAVCVPDCVGRNCGPDGCGGQCGTCNNTMVCKDFGRCTPEEWSCAPADYASGGLCDCGCGAPDPDCATPGAVLKGCGPYQGCDAQGKCTSLIPAAWTCSPGSYAANDACDCGCGAPDPDCGNSDLMTKGCVGSASCKADGTCAACVPNCSGKSCGDDGCGGLCGTCSDPAAPACDAGKCVSLCSPTPILCKVNQCGDDGCGGSCGTCPKYQSCQGGKCVGQGGADPMSCEGYCGASTPAGCYCTPGCAANGNCCPDYAAQCTCKPDCNGKQCGDNGCGGSCGTCPADKKFCDKNQQCTAACTPKCNGKQCGDDGCGGSCGTCQSGSSCAWTQKCVPSTWQCDASYYADETACDCSCGAPDPDCKVAGSDVVGCPPGVSCGASGTCSLATCTANSDCKDKWCTGKYFQGGGKFAGSCAVPVPAAKAPGYPCSFDLQCASGVCAQGLCRLYCKQASDCPPGQGCVGVLTENDGGAQGFAPVCQPLPGSLTACKAQADCKGKGEQCVAYPDPQTLQATYLCTDLPELAYGASCASKACPAGHLCVIAKLSYQCTLPCPAGNSDCPSGWTCSATSLHTSGTADPLDDPKVPVCIPN